MKPCEVIALANQKGGVGKTVTSMNLGVSLAQSGKKVLLIDHDPQGNLTSACGFRDMKLYTLSINDVYSGIIKDLSIPLDELILHTDEGVDLVPANLDFSGIELMLTNVMSRETVLKRFIASVKDKYDYIIIDTNPTLGLLPINALTASTSVIIPVQAEPFAVDGMGALLQSVFKVKELFNPDLKIGGVVITMADERTNLCKQINSQIREQYGNHIRIFSTVIPRRTKTSESTGIGESSLKYDPSGDASLAYLKLSKEVVRNDQKERQRHSGHSVR
ncbi:MAG: ParA family protein [Erysipelotrichaceae bacterium]